MPMSNTSYQLPPLRPAPSTFPTTGNYGPGPGTMSNPDSFSSQISSLMGGPAGMALSGLGAVGSFLNARAQRKEDRRKLDIQQTTSDNQFAAQHGLNTNQHDVNRNDLLLQRQREEDQIQRYLANQNAKTPMMQALLARLGGIAGSGGLAQVAAPGRIADMSGLVGAVGKDLGTYTPYKPKNKRNETSEWNYSTYKAG